MGADTFINTLLLRCKKLYSIFRLQLPCCLKKCSIIKVSYILLALLFSISAKAQNLDTDIKSFQTRLSNARADSDRVHLLFDLGNLYAKQPTGYNTLALNCYQKGFALSNSLKLIPWQNKFLLQIAIQYGILKEFKKCREAYMQVVNYWIERNDWKQAISTLNYLQGTFRWTPNKNIEMLNETVWCLDQERMIYLKIGDKTNAILCLKDEADANLNMGKLALAENELLNVISQLKTIHYYDLYDTYFLLGALYQLKGNLNKELYYCIETVKENQVARDTSTLGMFYYKLAKTYEDLDMHEQSLLFYKKILAGNNFKDAYSQYVVCCQICKVMIRQHKAQQALYFLKNHTANIHPSNPEDKTILYNAFAICYVALKQNNLAEYYFLKMIDSENYSRFPIGNVYETRFMNYFQICEFYASIKNYVKAENYIKMALVVPNFNISALKQSEFQLLQFKVDSALGHFISAIQHFEIHKKLTDSIFNAQEANQVADIQAKYETEAKDKNIQILTKQSQLQKASLKQAAFTRNVTFGGVAMLALMLALGFNRYQLKQKSNMQLRAQQAVINNKNIALEQLVNDKDKLLDDKEWLLKEIHHRVKNNLQIVISLLNTQSVYIDNTEALGAIRESQHRMQSISLIHQKLYQSDNLAKIDMIEYIDDLVEYLKDSFGIAANIQLMLEIEPISLDVVHAVPIGLILNEAITNAIKYAFPRGKEGIIQITLEETRNNEYYLIIKDNGQGLPNDFNLSNSGSLGMSLISGLTRQLQGKFTIQSNQGVEITVIIPTRLIVKTSSES